MNLLRPGRRVVTAADMVAGQVRLDISCLDQVYPFRGTRKT